MDTVGAAVAVGTTMNLNRQRKMTKRGIKAAAATNLEERGRKMLRLKNCPRCKGDILIDRDYFGWYEQCIQCGYRRDLDIADNVREYGRRGIQYTPGEMRIITEARK